MTVETVLPVVELVHWLALGVMMLVYTIRLMWLFRFKAGKDRQKPGDHGNTSVSPALYSMANVAMPWAMESTRKGFGFYLSFVVFHIGVVAGITLAMVHSLYHPLFEIPAVAYAFMGLLAAASLVGLARIIRRLVVPVMKLISTPDDYFSVIMLTGWFASGALAQAHIIGLLESQWFLVAFLAYTSFFLLYVPFSKISHYLYYPITRWYIGKTLGHRGSLMAQKA
jgi:hypothetical protein